MYSEYIGKDVLIMNASVACKYRHERELLRVSGNAIKLFCYCKLLLLPSD